MNVPIYMCVCVYTMYTNMDRKRIDIHYMFRPSSAEVLDGVITLLPRACIYGVGRDIYL